MNYMVEVDEEACAAHGDCVELAPEVFDLQDVARVIGSGPDDVLFAAAEACPSVAIRVLDARTNQQVYP
jgi:ferredoxin